MEDSWFSPDSIRFTNAQIVFLVKYFHTIKAGDWMNPNGLVSKSGKYLDIIENSDYELLGDTSIANIKGGNMVSSPPASDRTLTKVYYQDKILEIFNELDARLNRCDDKDLLIERYANDIKVEQLCRMLKVKRNHIYYKCQRAIKYLSGRTRKKIDYKTWLRNKGG